MSSAVITNALIAKLGSDATLLSYMRNGVYRDVPPPNSTAFVIVSMLPGAGQVDYTFDGRAIVVAVYLIEARARKLPTGSYAGDVNAAMAEVDAILDPQPGTSPYPATLNAAGYELMDISLEDFVEGVEPDDHDTSILWNRRGGHYRVTMAVA